MMSTYKFGGDIIQPLTISTTYSCQKLESELDQTSTLQEIYQFTVNIGRRETC